MRTHRLYGVSGEFDIPCVRLRADVNSDRRQPHDLELPLFRLYPNTATIRPQLHLHFHIEWCLLGNLRITESLTNTHPASLSRLKSLLAFGRFPTFPYSVAYEKVYSLLARKSKFPTQGLD